MNHNSEEGRGVKTEAVWFKLFPAKWAGMTMREPDNGKLGERVRRIILALCEQEPGVDAFADAVMQTTIESMLAATDHARKAAEARWGKTKGKCPSNARASDGEGGLCSSNATRRDLGDVEDLGDVSIQERRGD